MHTQPVIDIAIDAIRQFLGKFDRCAVNTGGLTDPEADQVAELAADTVKAMDSYVAGIMDTVIKKATI